jgi:hypothetical protein
LCNQNITSERADARSQGEVVCVEDPMDEVTRVMAAVFDGIVGRERRPGGRDKAAALARACAAAVEELEGRRLLL